MARVVPKYASSVTAYDMQLSGKAISGQAQSPGGYVTDQLIITHESDHIQVISNGEKSFQFAEMLWTKVRDACRAHDCFDVLGIAETTVPIETYDALEIADLFERLEINEKFRIAWVELNPEGYRTVYFIESVLSNRGFPGRVFLEVAEAKNWLLGSSNS